MQACKRSFEGEGGFTYLILLFSIAILGIGLATTGVIWGTESRLAKQRELEFIGQSFIQAIESYYHATPGEIKSYPQTLEDLVKDSRFLFTKRHLRKIYLNPFTQKTDWNYITWPSGGIAGIKIRLNETQFRQFTFQPQNVEHQINPVGIHSTNDHP